MAIDMKEIIGMSVAVSASVALLILVCFAAAKVSGIEDEREEQYWKGKK